MTDTDILAGLVRPLVWVETAPGLCQSDVFMIDTKCLGKNGGVLLIYHYHHWEYSTLEAAQAAANAYHVDRVLASIYTDKLRTLVETAQWARNRLDIIADESWYGDGRDLKRSIIGIFADFDKALSGCSSHAPTAQVDKDT